MRGNSPCGHTCNTNHYTRFPLFLSAHYISAFIYVQLKIKCDINQADLNLINLTLLKATNRLKLTWNKQSNGGRDQSSMKARRTPYRAHGNFNASSRLSDKYYGGAGRSAHKDHYPDNHCLSFVSIQARRRDFHYRCECSISDPTGWKNWPLMSQVVRLARLETGSVQKSGPSPE